MKFIETCIFQVNPKKIKEFEHLASQIRIFASQYDNLKYFEIMKRTHRIIDKETIKTGKPAKELTRVVKSVKYVMHLEFENEIDHGIFTRDFFEAFNKEISRCVIMPPDKLIGISI